MAKITLTADEELMYLKTLDRMQELMPDLEIEVTGNPFLSRMTPTNLGEDFKKFLKANPATTATPAYKKSA
jgi:hypothetical protein